MSRPLSPAQLRALEPSYTIGMLFQSGMLGAGDETAIEEISAIRGAFSRWVTPSKGWFSPRGGNGAPAVPRQLANGPAWRRYKSWRSRWSRQIIAPSPGVPWGLTAADVVTVLITEPRTFSDLAPLTGKSARALVDLFVASVHDYGQELVQLQARFWAEWDGLNAQLNRPKRRGKDHQPRKKRGNSKKNAIAPYEKQKVGVS